MADNIDPPFVRMSFRDKTPSPTAPPPPVPPTPEWIREARKKLREMPTRTPEEYFQQSKKWSASTKLGEDLAATTLTYSDANDEVEGMDTNEDVKARFAGPIQESGYLPPDTSATENVSTDAPSVMRGKRPGSPPEDELPPKRVDSKMNCLMANTEFGLKPVYDTAAALRGYIIEALVQRGKTNGRVWFHCKMEGESVAHGLVFLRTVLVVRSKTIKKMVLDFERDNK